MSSEPIDGDTASPNSADSRARHWKLLRITVSLALLAILVWQLDLRAVLAHIAQARFDLLLVALGMLVLWRYVGAYRWYALLRGKNPEVTLRRVARLVLTSTFLSYFLPGMGAEAVRLYSLSRVTSDSALIFTSLLVERVTALIALIAFVLVGLMLVPLQLPRMIGIVAGLGLVILVLGTLVVMHPKPRSLTVGLLHPKWLSPVRTRVEKVYRCLDMYRDQPGLLAWSLVLGFAIHFLRIAPTAVTAWALDLDVPFVDFLVIVPVIFLLSNLPISIGGLGVREASYVYLFGLVGVSAEAAFSLAIVANLLRLLSVLPGAWVYARRGIEP